MRLDTGQPGEVALIGAIADRSKFAIAHHGPERMSFGGRGWWEVDALASCMGEAAEHLSFYERNGDPFLLEPGSIDLDPSQLAWAENTAGGPLDNRPRLRGFRPYGRSAYLPADLILRRPPQLREAFRASETTGLAAGPTPEVAIENALLEAIERDAVALWWWGGAPGRPLPATFPVTSNRKVWCLDITSDLGVPVVAVLSSSQTDDAIVAGFAAARTPLLAANRAFMELRQMETALALSFYKLQNETPDVLTIQDRASLDRAMNLSLKDHPWLAGEPSVTRANNFASEETPLVDILSEAGLEAFLVDLTRPDIKIPVMRAIIPGLQPIKSGSMTDRLSRMMDFYPNARATDLLPPT